MGNATTVEGAELATICARLADATQAEDIIILDLRGDEPEKPGAEERRLSSITDYFVICTGTSNPHVRAIRRDIIDGLREDHEVRPVSTDGEIESQWVVLDYSDVVVHVFHSDQRSFYALEDLWADAPRLDWSAE